MSDEKAENDFDIVARISGIEGIAAGRGIRDLRRLHRKYGLGRWRKFKGFTLVRDRATGETYAAEIHWYEASGIGRKEFKIKRRLEPR